MKIRVFPLVTAVAALVGSAPLLAQSAPGLTRDQVREDMVRYASAGFNPARMNPRTWVDDAQAAAVKVQAARNDDASTHLAGRDTAAHCD
ncbi:hypothetical protein CFB46_30615 [Burkholderia sp. HI2761]|uniref:DUF4148 domain-containing protein n=1 Tax=Burkholderia TaxID=32008 RepID=UPI0004057625|nr:MULTISPECIES: DUF4148 domain-containing protein [Burkholderia]MPV60785.1 DUF4148 domain-containing protein [Burkholderia sp. BE24]OXJ22184.1 hypothetical protein CFB46_30615 [Burkholderia sp. HI2761]